MAPLELHGVSCHVTSVLGVPFFVVILVGQEQRAALWGRG